MKTSQAGINLIASYEAPNGPDLKAYWDEGDGWTIGYGHLMEGVPRNRPPSPITIARAKELLAGDLAAAEAAVAKHVTVTLSQAQFDACVALAFNIGEPQFAASSVVRGLNAGDPFAACAAFLLWHKDGGKKVRGLMRRRCDEALLFCRDAWA